jgi:DNA-binding Lrp family transcriptional regulator
MDNLLKLLAENARLSLEELSSLTGAAPEAVADRLDEYRSAGIVAGYQAVINYDKLEGEVVSSIIELKVSPKRDLGFDEFAETISRFPEVDSVYLMSGGYDILVRINGGSFKDIALFVARRLSPMESVLSTATHFVLKTYKERGFLFAGEKKDERGLTTL